MSPFTTLIAVAAVVSIGLFAGVLLAASIAISPSLSLLDGPNFTRVKQAQIRILQVSMSLISTVYTLCALYLLYVAKTMNLTNFFWVNLIAFILILIALGYSAITDIPFNKGILKWEIANPPKDWTKTRDQWDVANRLRTIPTIIAFILQAYALLLLIK